MRKDRLEVLAKHLDGLPPETFNIGVWKCRSTACAVGHACTIPEFQADGLKLIEDSLNFMCPKYENFTAWDAVRCFFECSYGMATHLFYTNSYFNRRATGPKEVAERIREVIKEAKDD